MGTDWAQRSSVAFYASWQFCFASIAGNGCLCGDDPSEKDLCLNTNCFCVTEVFNKKHFAL